MDRSGSDEKDLSGWGPSVDHSLQNMEEPKRRCPFAFAPPRRGVRSRRRSRAGREAEDEAAVEVAPLHQCGVLEPDLGNKVHRY